MNNEQINEAIATACGWEGCPECDNPICEDNFIPNYCNDLNAMREAEKVLRKEQVREYQTYMYDMACEIKNTCGRWMPYSATAAYRAEAFLKTLGKWEEAE
jgi:hypothetical protein